MNCMSHISLLKDRVACIVIRKLCYYMCVLCAVMILSFYSVFVVVKNINFYYMEI